MGAPQEAVGEQHPDVLLLPGALYLRCGRKSW